MRCTSFCTAESYKISAIAAAFKSQGYAIKNYRKVLYISYAPPSGDIFIFNYGCVVIWGLTSRKERELLKELEQFAVNKLAAIESDYFIAKHGNQTEMITHEKLSADIIVLENDGMPLKLAISHGLAQSIQLESYETATQKTIEKNACFPEQLAKTGRISLSQKAIIKRIGEIFIARNYINLNSEFLADPDFFWEHPNLETYYWMGKKFLDIPRRVSALNQKLGILHELFEMLTGQLQHKRSNMLETIIILLILIEVAISLITLRW